MNKKWRRGESDIDGILILAVLAIIIIVTPKNPSPPRSDLTPGTSLFNSITSVNPTSIRGKPAPALRSSEEASSIKLNSGNAPYAYQPFEEYITIENHSDSPVNITGWQLKNGKDRRVERTGGMLQRFSADIAVIPQAALLLAPDGNNIFQNVILGGGERAIVTTGKVAVQSPYKIVSFKENICTGYLETSPDYAFTPALNQSCSRPYLEPGVENLDNECRTFINSLSSCRAPEFNAKDPDGNPCTTCANGKILSSSCADFIKEHFSYRGCVAYHKDDPKFYGRTWRVFLGRGWEMWNDEYETIELFDSLGQLVDYQNY